MTAQTEAQLTRSTTNVPHPTFWRARCQGSRPSDGADAGLRAPFMICTMQMAGTFVSSPIDAAGTMTWVSLWAGPSELPVDRVLGLVQAVGAGRDRRLEVPAEVRMDRAEAPDRRPDALGDRRARPLGRSPAATAPPPEPEGGGEVIDEGVQLDPGAVGAGVVVVASAASMSACRSRMRCS